MALGEFIIMWNNMFYNGKWKKKPNLSKEWTKHEFLYDHLVHPLKQNLLIVQKKHILMAITEIHGPSCEFEPFSRYLQ